MNLLTKYSFVAIESHIDAIAMDEYLLKSNRGGETGRKLTRENEVIQWNLNILNNKGNKMHNNETTDIAHDLNLEGAENTLNEILEKKENYPEESIVSALLSLYDKLFIDLETLEHVLETLNYFKHMKNFIEKLAIAKIKPLRTKIFELIMENIVTEDDIGECRFVIILGKRGEIEEYILFLEKVLDIKPDSSRLEKIINDLYTYEMPLTHSDAERISSILKYSVPSYSGNFLLLPTK